MLIPEVFGRPGKVAELISFGTVATENNDQNAQTTHCYGDLLIPLGTSCRLTQTIPLGLHTLTGTSKELVLKACHHV